MARSLPSSTLGTHYTSTLSGLQGIGETDLDDLDDLDDPLIIADPSSTGSARPALRQGTSPAREATGQQQHVPPGAVGPSATTSQVHRKERLVLPASRARKRSVDAAGSARLILDSTEPEPSTVSSRGGTDQQGLEAKGNTGGGGDGGGSGGGGGGGYEVDPDAHVVWEFDPNMARARTMARRATASLAEELEFIEVPAYYPTITDAEQHEHVPSTHAPTPPSPHIGSLIQRGASRLKMSLGAAAAGHASDSEATGSFRNPLRRLKQRWSIGHNAGSGSGGTAGGDRGTAAQYWLGKLMYRHSGVMTSRGSSSLDGTDARYQAHVDTSSSDSSVQGAHVNRRSGSGTVAQCQPVPPVLGRATSTSQQPSANATAVSAATSAPGSEIGEDPGKVREALFPAAAPVQPAGPAPSKGVSWRQRRFWGLRVSPAPDAAVSPQQEIQGSPLGLGSPKSPQGSPSGGPQGRRFFSMWRISGSGAAAGGGGNEAGGGGRAGEYKSDVEDEKSTRGGNQYGRVLKHIDSRTVYRRRMGALGVEPDGRPHRSSAPVIGAALVHMGDDGVSGPAGASAGRAGAATTTQLVNGGGLDAAGRSNQMGASKGGGGGGGGIGRGGLRAMKGKEVDRLVGPLPVLCAKDFEEDGDLFDSGSWTSRGDSGHAVAYIPVEMIRTAKFVVGEQGRANGKSHRSGGGGARKRM